MIGTVDHFYTQTCGRCKTSNILVDRRAGDVTCLSCGRVLQSRILDNGDETLSYDDDKGGKLSRTSGMTDPILGSSETVYAGSTKAARKQLERVQKSIADRSEKNILRFIPNINEICANLHLPGTVKVQYLPLFLYLLYSS
jgi:transcription initiation factor TFIIIB Brf1 subunit/transcription initiation factor TFIIB